MATLNKQVHLASRPDGEPTTANFRFVEAPVAALRDGPLALFVLRETGATSTAERIQEYTHHFEPCVVDFDELADRRVVAHHVHLGAFSQDAYQGTVFVIGLVEKSSLGKLQAMNRAVRRPDSIELGYVAGRLG